VLSASGALQRRLHGTEQAFKISRAHLACFLSQTLQFALHLRGGINDDLYRGEGAGQPTRHLSLKLLLIVPGAPGLNIQAQNLQSLLPNYLHHPQVHATFTHGKPNSSPVDSDSKNNPNISNNLFNLLPDSSNNTKGTPNESNSTSTKESEACYHNTSAPSFDELEARFAALRKDT
jgi:hypothetical protein